MKKTYVQPSLQTWFVEVECQMNTADSKGHLTQKDVGAKGSGFSFDDDFDIDEPDAENDLWADND